MDSIVLVCQRPGHDLLWGTEPRRQPCAALGQDRCNVRSLAGTMLAPHKALDLTPGAA